MKRNNYRILFLSFIIMFVLFLTSCSCGGNNKPKTLYANDTTSLNLIEWVNQKLTVDNASEKTNEQILSEKKELAKTLIANYALYENIVSKAKYEYRANIIKNIDVPNYTALVDLATLTTDTDVTEGSSWVSAATYVKNCTGASNGEANKILTEYNSYSKELTKEVSVNDVVSAFVLQVANRTEEVESEPIHFYTGKDFWSHIFNNLFVFPVAWLIVAISNLLGGYYILGLLIATLLIRSLAWPIYAKTNDMSLKMQLMQPELNKIQEKYGNRQDERSRQMQQMEMAQLYKKYKVGIGGCLLPFIQFPIFMAIYRAVSRIPYTVSYNNTIYDKDWANELNSKFLGLDLFQDRTAGNGQFIGIIILVLIVVGTQFLSQWLSTKRQKKNQDAAQADIPLYRRQSYEQQKNSTQSSMKTMLYMMMLMMGLFVFTSKAGLGVYWCIGNIYSIFQMEINHRTSGKQLENLKKKF